MYTEPSWTQLLVYGTVNDLVFIILSLLLAIGITHLIAPKLTRILDVDDDFGRKIVRVSSIILLFVIICVPMSIASAYTWNVYMEQPSVREDTITVTSIQPLPGAVVVNQSGYSISNSNQLMFITRDGREFANTENWMFNKFETRTIFNKLKVNGTYRVKYYGWRNGRSNEFPNILSVEQVIDENGTSANDFNKYFGAYHGNRGYDVNLANEYGD